MRYRRFAILSGFGLASAATGALALFAALYDSQRPNVLPLWFVISSIVLFLGTATASVILTLRANRDGSTIPGLLLAFIACFAILWSVLEVVAW